MAHKVFVYGTLKRGFPNHDQWMAGFEYLGAYRTMLAYPLLIGGPWFTIQMLPEPGCGHRVDGELYRVDDDGLALLDQLESVGKADGYTRQVIDVESSSNQVETGVWTYFKERSYVDPVHGAPLKCYQLDPRYVPARLRT